MNRIIRYAINHYDGTVISRVGDEIACPVLDYAAIGGGGEGFPAGDFRGPTKWQLEKMPVLSFRSCWLSYQWTKKIPTKLKNRHRKFWGMKPLKGKL